MNEDNYKLNKCDEASIYSKLRENDYEMIKNSFKAAENELTEKKIDTNLSGSTSVIVFIIADNIICANAGDSRAIMARKMSKIILIKILY
jgi:serine/threonine protein phosphatase PrpC